MATIAEINSHGKYALNPRGNLWLNDKDKLGEKLMKKMGWSEGKGLGKSENGIKENIKVKLKNNNSGVGFENKCTDVSNSDYEVVLNDLWQNYAPRKEQCIDSSLSDGSLEGRSQKFKNRLHYRKFVLGKDISQYSEKDMQSIFVSKSKKEKESEGSNQENAEEEEAIINGFQDKLTKNVLNIVDYFNQKLKHKKSDASEKNEPSLNSEATVKCLNSDTSDCEQNAECLSESHAITSGKKRKKSKAVMLTDQNEGITQCSSFATNGLDTPETNCETEEPKKKKKRKKSDIIEEADINDSDHLKICSSDSSPVKKSKRRKKSKTEIIEEDSENQMCNGSNNLSEQETLHNSDNMLQNKKRKKPTDLYSKAKKLKTNTISKLKSCLKHNLLKPSLKKQVSFCKDISFRTFASESAIDSMDEEQVADINAPELEIDLSHENTNDEKDTEIDKKIETTLNVSESVETIAETKSKTELEACISETVSPVKRTSVYNSWLDSHRQALKMKMYKGMYKNIKEHYIFQSTNLTQIKGYGNWGY